jgi:hypothetical protein
MPLFRLQKSVLQTSKKTNEPNIDVVIDDDDDDYDDYDDYYY